MSKKDYLKPDAEYISLAADEVITDDASNLVSGITGYDPDATWPSDPK